MQYINFRGNIRIFIGLFSVFSPFFVSAASITVSPAVSNTSLGSNTVISINIADISDLFGVAFDLIFDPSMINFVSAQKGTFLEQGGTPTTLLTSASGGRLIVGYSRQAVGGTATGISGSGTLMTVTFGSLAGGTSNVTFQNNSLCSSSGYGCSAIPATWNTGSIVITGSASPDTTAPSVPTSLSATAVSSSQINLSWGASTDAVGVTGYRIYRNGTLLTTSTTNSYSSTGLSAGTTYSYAVAAYDAAGNVSNQSSSVSANTQGAPVSGGGGGGGGGGSQTSSDTAASAPVTISNVPISIVAPSVIAPSAIAPTTQTTATTAVATPVSTPPAIIPSVTYTFATNLFYGMKGNPDVKNLQNVLQREGFLSPTATIDGSFGPLTKSAVVKFQQKYSITPASGFVGGLTRAKLSALSTPTAQAPTSSNVSFSRNLSIGSRGDDVKSLQGVLTRAGVYAGPITSYFGPLTKAAVVKFQQKYGITPVSGFVGPLTRGKLVEVK